ncbi:hypothetical protein C5O80_18255 [Burkholderia sp. SRS-46]|nr:hypothetical protein C5O80_18255 [Burkholderia sp. SRS-46]
MVTKILRRFRALACIPRSPLVAIALVALSSPAAAECFIDGLAGPINEQVALDAASLVRDTAIGTKYAHGSGGNIACNWQGYNVNSTATVVGGKLVPGYTDTYETGVKGIGIRFFATAYGITNTQVAPFNFNSTSSGSATTTWFNAGAQLFVTGPIQGGTMTTLPSLRVEYRMPSSTLVYNLSVATPIVIGSKGCRVSVPSIAVTLPTVTVKDLNSPGTAWGATKFAVNLTGCAAGVKLYTTLTDASNPSNTSNVLSLSPDSSARGVAYQIAFGGKSVNFGPDSSAPGTTNQFLVNAAPGATVDVPLTVNYVKTGENLVPGTANAKVIFNMSYR